MSVKARTNWVKTLAAIATILFSALGVHFGI